jgi:hypothetical protein
LKSQPGYILTVGAMPITKMPGTGGGTPLRRAGWTGAASEGYHLSKPGRPIPGVPSESAGLASKLWQKQSLSRSDHPAESGIRGGALNPAVCLCSVP